MSLGQPQSTLQAQRAVSKIYEFAKYPMVGILVGISRVLSFWLLLKSTVRNEAHLLVWQDYPVLNNKNYRALKHSLI